MSDFSGNNSKNLNVWLPLLFAAVLVLGIMLGFRLQSASSSTVGALSESGAEGSERVEELLRYIEEKYVDEVDVNFLVDKAIDGILEELDPHSNYITPEQIEGVNDELKGNFEGIGIQFTMLDDTIFVITPIENGPSEKVGIRAGDRVIEIEDSLVAGIGIDTEGVINKLKGEKGSKVKLKIKRSGESQLLDFEIIRDKVPIYSVEASYMLNPKTGYIKLNRFSATTYKEFMDGIDKMSEAGMKDLVIDLRQNPGGYLNAATKILDQIFKERQLLVYTQGKNYDKNEYRSTGRNFYEIDKIALLIDEGSASASEIMAGAVQDSDRGLIVGRRSFGKGLVQEQYNLRNGGALRLTVARYYTPSNRSIQKPYKDRDNYNEEMYDRYQTGELENADSIQIGDTTKYYTDGKRVVYGGGGINPDVFVPIDSIIHNAYFTKVAPYIPAFVYADLDSKKRAKIAKLESLDNFMKRYVIDESMMQRFISFTKSKEIDFEAQKYNLSKKSIKTRIKAHIARQFYGDLGFYRVLYQNDPMIKIALEEMQKPIIADM